MGPTNLYPVNSTGSSDRTDRPCPTAPSEPRQWAPCSLSGGGAIHSWASNSLSPASGVSQIEPAWPSLRNSAPNLTHSLPFLLAARRIGGGGSSPEEGGRWRAPRSRQSQIRGNPSLSCSFGFRFELVHFQVIKFYCRHIPASLSKQGRCPKKFRIGCQIYAISGEAS